LSNGALLTAAVGDLRRRVDAWAALHNELSLAVEPHQQRPAIVACQVFAALSCCCPAGASCRCELHPAGFGVNFALHRTINRGATLPGLLRGCAEQNAMGSLAASGVPYAAVRAVVVYGQRVQRLGTCQCASGSGSAAAVSAAPLAVVPCSLCVALLCAVAREVQRGRGPEQRVTVVAASDFAEHKPTEAHDAALLDLHVVSSIQPTEFRH
jgi:hypothetical protein